MGRFRHVWTRFRPFSAVLARKPLSVAAPSKARDTGTPLPLHSRWAKTTMGPKPVKSDLFQKWPRTLWGFEMDPKRILYKVICLTSDKPSPFEQPSQIINPDTRGTTKGTRSTRQGMRGTTQEGAEGCSELSMNGVDAAVPRVSVLCFRVICSQPVFSFPLLQPLAPVPAEPEIQGLASRRTTLHCRSLPRNPVGIGIGRGSKGLGIGEG